MPADAESVLDIAQRWVDEGRRVAWATVIATWSSSPRPIGSQMVIADDGRFAGSVSGGCVEAAVIQASLEVLQSGRARALAYGVSTEDAWAVGLPCGGKIEVFVSELPGAVLRALREARASRSSCTCVMDVASGSVALWSSAASAALPAAMASSGTAPSVTPPSASVPGPDMPAARASDMAAFGLALGATLVAAVERAARDELSRLIEAEGRRLFALVLTAAPRLVVVGAVHLSQTLTELAVLDGFEVIVVDPRTAFATEERFPRARLVHDWPDVALSELALDRRTAVVVLSHDAKLDEPALSAALQSECFYIGALGSQRTQAARRRKLVESGFAESDVDRIYGPVGLDIGALTTPEIAIAIMAEIIQVRRKPALAQLPAE